MGYDQLKTKIKLSSECQLNYGKPKPNIENEISNSTTKQ